MAAEPISPPPTASVAKPPTPKSPATRDLGMRATLLFPNREIAQQYYLPLIYTACRTCYSELEPQDIFDRATSGQVATEKQQDLIGGSSSRGTARPSNTSSSPSPSVA